jgi:hypothetical protein
MTVAELLAACEGKSPDAVVYVDDRRGFQRVASVVHVGHYNATNNCFVAETEEDGVPAEAILIV